jgi:hypothetical protein
MTAVKRPERLCEVAAQSRSLEDFGLLLREFNQTLRRMDQRDIAVLPRAIVDEPELLRGRFEGGEIADAYLAAYAEWLAQQADVAWPDWTAGSARSLERPWFADEARASLLVLAPASFRQRGVFTVPENVLRPQPRK